jgi:hypothetical protein
MVSKMYTRSPGNGRCSAVIAGLGLLESFLAYWPCPHAVWLGFMCGLGAFGASFLGLEIVASRVFVFQDIKRGLASGVFWVVFKFFSPLMLIYYASLRGCSILAVFCGLLVGLCNTTLVLFGWTRFFVKIN